VTRVLIANIRNLGACPCPRCAIPKNRTQDLATDKDVLQRQVLARKDNDERRVKISSARKLIYEQHFVVDATRVEDLLKAESLVPTKVGSHIVHIFFISTAHPCVECVL
jgi:hypothetical protein